MVDKKIQFLDATLSLGNEMRYKKWLQYDSSAFKLETALEQRGIVLPKKLCHIYKCPDNQHMYDYYVNKHEKWMFMNWYTRNIITKGRKTGASVRENAGLYSLQDFFKFMFCLALSDKEELRKFFADKYAVFSKELQQDMDKFRELNPDLKSIDNYNNIDFLLGVMFGFAPEDIKFFIDVPGKQRGDKYNEDRERVNKKVEQLCGVHISYVLSPQNLKMVEKAIDEYMSMRVMNGYQNA